MGDRPDNNRQELQSALAAVTTSFAVGRPVSPAPSVPAAGKVELALAYDKLVAHEAAKPAFYIPPLPAKWKRYLKPAIIVASVTVAIYQSLTWGPAAINSSAGSAAGRWS